MKIAVANARYALSGVPLAQLRFARALAARGHEVDLIIGHVNPGFEAPSAPGVRIKVLGQPRVLGMLLPLVAYLRRERPDAVFAAGDHLGAAVLLAAILARSRAKVSVSSRVTPFDTYSNRPWKKGWFLKVFMRFLMPRADALTCVSKDMVDQYRSIFPHGRHVAVYNIVVDKEASVRMGETGVGEWPGAPSAARIVAAGALEPWKGFSDLLAAMPRVVAEGPVGLLVLGDGSLRGELERQASALGLDGVVRFEGYVQNPLKYFRQADVFVLSSHVEGMPNVLVEAMMCGCTPVATDCPTGPREVLQGGRVGYLVPMKNPDALANGIISAVSRPVPKDLLDQAVQPFSEEAVIRSHFELLGLDK